MTRSRPRKIDPTIGNYTPTIVSLGHLKALCEQARPEWDAGLWSIVLNDLAVHVRGNDLAIAALRLCSDPTAPGPKALRWRGAWWRDLATAPPEVQPHGWCAVCGRREPECYSSRLADDDHVFELTTRSVRR